MAKSQVEWFGTGGDHLLNSVQRRIRPIRVVALSAAFLIAVGFFASLAAQNRKASGTVQSSRRMADGKRWTTRNLDVNADPSYCYDDAALNCRRYGRLYTWESARQACESLGDGWRLPTNEEWRQLAEHYGGLLEESPERGRATFKELITGGSSGFNAVLGGGRTLDGQYSRLEAHGFYWTASESSATTAWLYNFGKGMHALNRHSDMEKQRAFSVRCVSK